MTDGSPTAPRDTIAGPVFGVAAVVLAVSSVLVTVQVHVILNSVTEPDQSPTISEVLGDLGGFFVALWILSTVFFLLPLAVLSGVIAVALGVAARLRGARSRSERTSWITGVVALALTAGICVDLVLVF